jgi:hypothetical protein
MIKSVMMFPI